VLSLFIYFKLMFVYGLYFTSSKVRYIVFLLITILIDKYGTNKVIIID